MHIFSRLFSSRNLRIPAQSLLMIACLCSCNRNRINKTDDCQTKYDTVYIDRFRSDTIMICDTIIREVKVSDGVQVSYILEPPMYDSVKTRELLDKSIWSKSIDLFKVNQRVELDTRSDLEYLPYLLLICNDYNKPIYDRKGEVFVSLCTECIDDKKLFNLGKHVVDRLNQQIVPYYQDIEYPDSFNKGGMFTYRNYVSFKPTAIDTLRVRALAYNDRDALEELEKYYMDKGDDKGIAIYYKVMLGYEGNGDLAERFYRVLEPHFDKTPELRSAVREVLLRAALCDHNERAQELCDSLGFSLCDYRMHVPDGTY